MPDTESLTPRGVFTKRLRRLLDWRLPLAPNGSLRACRTVWKFTLARRASEGGNDAAPRGCQTFSCSRELPLNHPRWRVGLVWTGRRNAIRLLRDLVIVVCCLCGAASAAEETSPTMWKTGQELERQLDTALGITWAGNPLRRAVGNLARTQQVAIFVDRRVDPEQELQFSVNDVALRHVLQRLAEDLKLGTCRVGPVSYLGPKSAADALGTLTAIKDEQSRRLPADVRGRLARTKPLRWAELSTPRELLGQFTQEADFRLEGLEQIPHDLWPAVDLPSLTLTQRLSLLLIGFDLTFEVSEDGRTIQLTPLPTNRVFERSYTVTSQHTSAWEQLARRFPQASLTREPGKVTVAGPLEVHEAVRELLTPKRTGPPPRTKPAAKAENKA